MYGCSKGCLSLIPFRLPQISCFSLNLKCFSSDSDNCPNVVLGPLLQFPHAPRAGPVLLTLLFFSLVSSFYWVLRGSIYFVHWSSTPVFSQLMFCMHFCVWRCIPDVSVNRDELHIHLLLCHLILSWPPLIFKETVQKEGDSFPIQLILNPLFCKEHYRMLTKLLLDIPVYDN